MKQYFSYFKWMFLIVAIMTGIVGIMIAVNMADVDKAYIRTNDLAPQQKVYDYADVLSDDEEQSLEDLIAGREGQIGCDIVLVTIDESLYDKYGYTQDTDANWEWCITEYAECFYIDKNFGYNIAGQNGDGALLLHNWHPIEKGLHVAHGGKVWDEYSDAMISDLLDKVYYKAKSNPYEAYKYYIEDTYREVSGEADKINLPPLVLFIITAVVSAIYIARHLKFKEGEKTTSEITYLYSGSVHYNVNTDTLLDKKVTTKIIQSSSGGGSGGGRSSGGSRMGGGSRRG